MNYELNNSHWSAWPLKNWAITAFITIVFLAFGLYGLEQMPKDEFPPFAMRMGAVVAVMPGATCEEIEAQVARPLERYIFTYKEVDRAKTTTQSMNGMCFMRVFFNQRLTHNLGPVWNKMKHGVNDFKVQLPQGVVALLVLDDFGEASALLITLESNERSYRELQEYSDELADRLRRVKSVSNVQQYGNKKEQISVYVNRERLAAYGIGQSALLTALSNEGLTTLSGGVSTALTNIPLHLATTRHSEQEVMDYIIYSDASGKVVRVRDIAEVKREYDTSDSYIESGGRRCVLLSLEMTEGYNIVHYGKEVNKVIETFREEYLPTDVEVLRITDQPKVVKASVDEFLINLIESMVVIILVMMILFPLRSAIVAAITIPLSTFISVGIMYMIGIPLNIVTLASLIVVLGMIVDNSIVVIDGYLEYLGKGMDRREAAILSVKQYFMPMLLATVCICAIFFPVLFTMKGIAHDVIAFFPATITICLMVSLVVAACIIPALNVHIIKKVQEKRPGKRSITDWVQDIYEVTLRWTFRHPWLTMCGSVVLVVLTALIFPTLKIRQFPMADRNQFACEVFLPESAGLDETKAITEALRDSLSGDERVTSITTFMGCSSPRFQVTYEPQLGGKNFAQLIVNTKSVEATAEVLDEYAPRLSNNWPGAYVRFKQMDYLPVPTYEYRFYGTELDSMLLAAESLMEYMRQMPELEWVHTDYDQPSPLVDVTLDPVAAAQLGVTRTAAELQLALQTGKTPIATIWEGNYEVPIVLRDKQTEQMQVSDMENLYITPLTQPTGSIPLRQVANVETQWKTTKIMHHGGERCVTVTAESKRGVLAADVQKRVEDIIEHDIRLPRGVRTETGGEPEQNMETVPDVIAGLAIALVIIFFFLLFNFRRFGLTGICMASILLSLPGAMIGLGIANITIGLTSIFGFITLMGIIMRNEILIFEHADQKVAEGMSVRDAAFDAGRRRMVPIFLTTATTAVGVIPMILGKSSFWMPVGIIILAGGIGTLILVVTVLPVVYWKLSPDTPSAKEENAA